MEKNFLLGIIKNQIIICNLELQNRNCKNEFTASFNVGEAFNVDDVNAEEWCESFWDSVDAKTKLDILNDGQRSYWDWVDEIKNSCDYLELIDCSCTNIELKFNHKKINFETVCCGQHDVRTESNYNKMIYTNKTAFDLIMYLWDNYHLKQLPENELKKLDKIILLLEGYKYQSYEENELINDFIINNLQMED